MAGSTVLAAHIAELQRQKAAAAKKEAARKAAAEAAAAATAKRALAAAAQNINAHAAATQKHTTSTASSAKKSSHGNSSNSIFSSPANLLGTKAYTISDLIKNDSELVRKKYAADSRAKSHQEAMAKQHPSTQKTAMPTVNSPTIVAPTLSETSQNLINAAKTSSEGNSSILSRGILSASKGNEAATIRNNTSGRTFVNSQGETVRVNKENSANSNGKTNKPIKTYGAIKGTVLPAPQEFDENTQKLFDNAAKEGAYQWILRWLDAGKFVTDLGDKIGISKDEGPAEYRQTGARGIPIESPHEQREQLENDITNISDKYNTASQAAAEAAGENKAKQFISDVVSAGTSSLMDLPLYLIPGVGEAKSVENASKIYKILRALKTPLTTPGTYGVMAESMGQRYLEALQSGASTNDAMLSALAYGPIMGYTESLGGAEKLVTKLLEKGLNPESIIKNVAVSAISEGGEEAMQQIIQSGTKAFYKNVPAYSNTSGEDAWINPKDMGYSAAVGATVGGLMGGAVSGGATIVNNGLSAAIGNNRSNGIEQSNKNDYNNIIESNGEANQSERTDTGKLGAVDNGTENSLDRETSGRLLQRSVVPETNQSIESAGTERQGNSGRLSGLLSASTREKMNTKGIPSARLSQTNDAGVFSRALDTAKASSQNGDMVDSKTPEELITSGAKMLLSENGMAGVAVEPSGNITAVFNSVNNPTRKLDKDLIISARESGGTHLDCYAKFFKNGDYAANNLVNKYANAGMTPVAWMKFDPSFEIPGGNPYGAPDVVFMARTSDGADQVIEKAGTEKIWTANEVHDLPEVADYEAGQQYAATIGKKNGAVAEKTTQSANELESQWNSLKDQYGTWKNEQAPQQINDTQIVSKFADNALENIEDPTIREELKRRVLDGELTHERYTDTQAQKNLANERAVYGEDAVNARVNQGLKQVSEIDLKNIVTGGIESLVDATNSGDGASALYMAQLLSEAGTNLGQGIQAYTQLKKLTPAGRILFAQQQINLDYSSKFKFAPEAIKADIDNNVRAKMPNIVDDAVSALDIPAAKIIKQGIIDGDINLSDELKKGNIKELTLYLTQYAINSKEVSNSESDMIDTYAAIWEELSAHTKQYRDSALKAAKEKAGKNPKRAYLDRLIEYNNLGCFDDQDAAAAIASKYNLPFLTEEDAAFIAETSEKAKLLSAGSREQRAEYAKINKLIGKKLKSSLGQKIRSVQVTGMLGTPKTMERNTVPNIAMLIPNTTGDFVATVLDKQIAKRTGQRTTGLSANPIAAAFDAAGGLKNTVLDAREGIDTSLMGNKYDVPMGDVFSDKHFAGKVMNAYSKAVYVGLQLGDRPFEDIYYNNSLRRQMQLNHVDKPTQLMEDIARTVATQRTWKDSNSVTQAVKGIVKFLNGGKEFGFGSCLIPFQGTPANIAKAIYDYSPLATASIAMDIKKLREADPGTDEQILAQFNLVNHVSKAFGGTVLMATIYALAKMGIIAITGAPDDNDDREKYKEEVLGWQPYSIKVGNLYISYAWILPFGATIAAGANLQENLDAVEKLGDDAALADFVDAFEKTFQQSAQVLYDQTFLQSLSYLFSGDDVTTGLVQFAANLPQQFIPAFVGQFAAAIDPYKRQTYMPNDFMGTMVRGIENKIPFLSETLPAKYDALGNPIERYSGEGASDVVNAFLNPAQTSTIKSSDVTDEISRLEESTGEKLYPNSSEYTIDFGGETVPLSADEMQDWNKTVGSEFNNSLEELMQSEAYQNMTDEQKASAISKIHEDLNAIYKYNLLTDKGYKAQLSTEYKKVVNAQKIGISVSTYCATSAALNSIKKDDSGTQSYYQRSYVFDMELDDKQTIYLLKAHGLLSDSAIASSEDLEENYGIARITYYQAWTELNNIESSTAGDKDYRLQQQRAYINSLDLTAEQKSVLDDRIINDGTFIPNDTQVDYSNGMDSATLSLMSEKAQAAYESGSKYVSTPISKMGLTAEQFNWAYDYMNSADGKKKADLAAKLDELDLPATTKSAILAARGYKPNYSFSDGGSVEVQDYSTAAEDSTAALANTTYTVGGNRNPVTKKRESVVPVVGEFRISSGFGKRNAPIAGASTYHKGVDLASAAGTPVVAVKDGTVTSVTNDPNGFGLSVEITHEDGTVSKYSHLSTESVKKGDTISEGYQLGEVGQSGIATGPHLDFRYKVDGEWVDPTEYFDLGSKSSGGSLSGTYVASKSSKSSSSSGSSSSSDGRSSGGSSSGGSGRSSGYLASSLIGKKSKYSRYSYSGYPVYSYIGNSGKK